MLANVNNMVSLGGFQPFGFAPNSYSNGNWTTDAGTAATGTSTNDLAVTSNASLSQVTGTITENTAIGGDASAFNGLTIYLVIFNGTSVGVSTEMGIFNSDATFPTNSNGGVPSDNSGLLSTGTGTPVTPATGNSGSVNSSPNQLELAASPEPSSLLATMLGAGGLLAMLRRRRSAA